MNLPTHLNTDHATGLKAGEVIAQFEIGHAKNFIYLILDWSTKKAAIVDPWKDLALPLRALHENGFELESILLTHTHWDHVGGVGPLLEAHPRLKVFVGKDDLHRVEEVLPAGTDLHVLRDEEAIQVGTLSLQVIHTPGHSAGEFCYFLKTGSANSVPYLFTGDTVFIRDCGRTDFEDGSNREMFASIQKIKRLPEETIFLVGHHYAKECATTLKQELISSAPFRCNSVEELANLP